MFNIPYWVLEEGSVMFNIPYWVLEEGSVMFNIPYWVLGGVHSNFWQFLATSFFGNFENSCEKLPKIAKNCRKLPKIVILR